MLIVECQRLIGKCGGCAGFGKKRRTKTHYFAATKVKIRSGKIHQWMQHLRGHVDEKQDISIVLKCLPIERLPVVEKRNSRNAVRIQARPDLVIKIIINEGQRAVCAS